MVRFPISRMLLTAAIACLAVVVVSCSDDDDDNPTGPGGNTDPNRINITGFDFSPAGKTITVGTTITWVNKDAVAHTVTSDNDAFTSSGNLAQNATHTFTFATPGVYPYHCSPHPTMRDTITVVP